MPADTPTPDLFVLKAQINELHKSINEYKALVELFIDLVKESPTENKKPLTDFERAEKLLTIADMMHDSPERNKILIKAANLFVGKKFV